MRCHLSGTPSVRLVCLGSTGEFANLSIDERKQVIDITIDQVHGRVPVMAGATVDVAVATTAQAYDPGAARS